MILYPPRQWGLSPTFALDGQSAKCMSYIPMCQILCLILPFHQEPKQLDRIWWNCPFYRLGWMAWLYRGGNRTGIHFPYNWPTVLYEDHCMVKWFVLNSIIPHKIEMHAAISGFASSFSFFSFLLVSLNRAFTKKKCQKKGSPNCKAQMFTRYWVFGFMDYFGFTPSEWKEKHLVGIWSLIKYIWSFAKFCLSFLFFSLLFSTNLHIENW